MTTHTIGTREAWLAAAPLGSADWLCLAAAPTFAIMALFTGVLGGSPQDMLCSAAQDASPLSGMVVMYMLMSAFHLGPWLKLIASPRNGAQRSRSGVDPDPKSSGKPLPRGLAGNTQGGANLGPADVTASQ
jgi:hypothetical protein